MKPVIAALIDQRDRKAEQLARQMRTVAAIQQECDDLDALIAAASAAAPGWTLSTTGPPCTKR